MRSDKLRMVCGQEEKFCGKCSKWIPTTYEGSPTFNKRKASPDGLSYNCKQCEVATAKASYERRKKKLQSQKRYKENKEVILERSKEYYQENKETLLAQNKAYREAHPEVWRKADKVRRDRIKSVPNDGYTRAEIIARDSAKIVGNDEYAEELMVPICQICMQPIFDDSLIQIDHIIPISEGGHNTKDNVRVTCKPCNISRPKDGRDLKNK